MLKYLVTLLCFVGHHTLVNGQSAIHNKISEFFDVKMINDLELSPDGKQVVFAAVGKVYIMDLKKAKPRQLVEGDKEYEFEPSFSQNGEQIIYSSWNENGYGKINIYNKKTKWSKTILITSGIFREPRFSRDGKLITYKKELEVAKVDTANQKTEGLYVLNLKDGDPMQINSFGEGPIFSRDNKKVIYQSGKYRFGTFVKTFESVNRNGQEKQTLFYGKYGHEYSISPGEKWVAWQELGKIYVSAFPKEPIGLSADNNTVDMWLVSDLPGNNLSWSDDNLLTWTIANTVYSTDVTKLKVPNQYNIALAYQRDIPDRVLALTNARIITMNGEEVIEHGTIIIKGNRIVDIGFGIKVPKEAYAINCSGKTIMPGLIDLDLRSNDYDYNLSPIQQWEFIEMLRAGITTKLDGGFNIANGFANRELIAAGKLLGPRLLNGGVRIVKNDPELFSNDSYEHYKKSNLHIAMAFNVTAIQTEVDIEVKGFLQFDNIQNDTSEITSKDIVNTIIGKSKTGPDPHKLLYQYTLYNAELIALSQQLGSIEKGKLADLIVIDGNPLEHMETLSNVVHTIINGRVYDCSTMVEVGNDNKRIVRKTDVTKYRNLNRATGSACCGFPH